MFAFPGFYRSFDPLFSCFPLLGWNADFVPVPLIVFQKYVASFAWFLYMFTNKFAFRLRRDFGLLSNATKKDFEIWGDEVITFCIMI